jgi:hypothetical protein
METEKPEHRESRTDLELGKAHLLEILDQLIPFIQSDEIKNQLALELKEQIRLIENTLQLKEEVGRIQSLVSEASSMVLRRKEDQSRLNDIHKQIILIEKGLAEDL